MEWLRRHRAVVIVMSFALAASVTSIVSDFTFDDRGVIFDNPRVHALGNVWHFFSETYWPPRYGGDGYRPLVILLFAVQWSLGHGAPWVFHAVNIALAVAAAVAVFWCARSLLSENAAAVVGCLFAVHPVHVEVTGNIVGQSELIVALCLAIAIGIYLRARRGDASFQSLRTRIIITVLFAIALFSKEHAIVLPAILVAAEWIVLPGASWAKRSVFARPVFLGMGLVASLYFLARSFVQKDLAGFVQYPIFRFLHMSPLERVATMMNEIPRVMRLLVFPTHLSGDYSPTDVVIAKGPDVTQLPGVLICLGVVILILALRKRNAVASFGLAWMVIAYMPVSNLLIPAGFVIAERTLFFPSIGLLIAAGALAEHVLQTTPLRTRRLAAVACAALLVAGTVKSIARQRVWKNNDVFFAQLMKDAPDGYRAHFLYARHVGLKSRLSEMEREYWKAIHIFPYDASMTIAVADAYTRAGLCTPAVALFKWSFDVEPQSGEGRYEYVYCLSRLNRWVEVREEAERGLPVVPGRDSRLMRTALREAALRVSLSQSARDDAKSRSQSPSVPPHSVP